MLRISLRKIFLFLLCVLMTFTCGACQKEEVYTKSEFVRTLAIESGIAFSDEEEPLEKALSDWKITGEDYSPEDPLDNAYLLSCLDILLDGEACPSLDERRMMDDGIAVTKKEAEKCLNDVLEVIDHRRFPSVFHTEKKKDIRPYQEDLSSIEEGDVFYDEENDGYLKAEKRNGEWVFHEAEIPDIYDEYMISGSFEARLDEAEIIPYVSSSNSHYTNTRYELLASPSKSGSFEFRGFTVTYTVSGSGLSLSARKVLGGGTLYSDFVLSNVRPSYRWNYKEGLKDAYFKVDFKTTETLGFRREKEKKINPTSGGISMKSFLSTIASFIAPDKGDSVEIPVCQIFIPVPELPSVSLLLDLSLRIYAGGKIEIALTHDHLLGFEVREGKLRTISEHDHDIRGNFRADMELSSSLSFALMVAKQRLMDLGINGGISGKVKTTVHLYDEDGNETVETVSGDHEAIEEASSAFEDVKVCADLSLNWLLSLTANSSTSLLGKMGFSFRVPVLTEKDQVFGNMTHLEDGHFVPACTRKSKKKAEKEKVEELTSEKLIPESSNFIMKAGESAPLSWKKIPEGYGEKDLLFTSESPDIATADNRAVHAFHKGNTRIRISTSDGKYSVYLHVLVSR